MKHHPTLWLFIAGASAFVFGACATGQNPANAPTSTPVPAPTAVAAKVDFATQVKPIFQNYCYQCHGNGQSRAGFHIDQKAQVMKQIIPGDPNRSYLYNAMTKSMGASDHMPPITQDQPGDDDIATIKLWIEQGANWPDGV
jgi:cytochrome c5